MNLSLGQRLGSRFRIEKTVGEGAMGTVYSASDEILGRTVAIKLLKPYHAADARFLERFLREAKIVAQLSLNPHVVTIYDLGRTGDGTPYLVTELLTGHPLSEEVQGDHRPSRSWVIEVGLQICFALVESHGRGVIHRDLKPANVFVVRTGIVPIFIKVLDFGLSRSAEINLSPSHATESGVIQGTPRYMAPETIAGDGTTEASDIYSLGMLLFEFATGCYPYQACSRAEELRAHLCMEPSPFPVERLSFPREFEKLVLSMLRKNPMERPTSRECLRSLSRMSRSYRP